MRRAALTLGLALALLPGCSTEDGDAVLTVLAASSLGGAYESLATRFESEHPGVDVRIVLGSSATLARQVVEGAPGDVLATADEATMRAAKSQAIDPEAFATNELVLLVRDNETEVEQIADLDAEGVTYVTCVPEAPCGALAAQALDGAHLNRPPVSYEADAHAVVGKVESGEVDAGFAYRTDATASRSLAAIALPGPLVTTYFVATLRGSERSGLASDFVTLVMSSAGQGILAEWGFGAT